MPDDNGAIPVPLSKTHYKALIDPADAALIVQYRWYISGGGYAVTFVKRADGGQTPWSMHRMLMDVGPGDGGEVDHINRNRLDNRRCNLRLGTKAQNDQNRPDGNRGKYSPHRGVSAHKNRWRAYITVGGRQLYLGVHADEMDAARAAEAARRAHMEWSPWIPELDPVGACPCKECRE